MITEKAMLSLVSVKRGSLATRYPNAFARRCAQLYAEMLRKDGVNVRR